MPQTSWQVKVVFSQSHATFTLAYSNIDDETRTIAAGIWSQPQLNDPNHSTPYIIHANEIVAKRREEENAGELDTTKNVSTS